MGHTKHSSLFSLQRLSGWLVVLVLAILPLVSSAQTKLPRLTRYFKSSTDPYKGRLIPVPLLSYSPETSWGFGLSAQYLFRTPSTDSTGNLSSVGLTLIYTLRKQFIINPQWDIFWRKQEFRLTGAALWQRYPDSYFGLGNETPKTGERYSSNYILVRNRITKQLIKGFQIGLQYRFEHLYNLETEEGGYFDQQEPPGTPGFTASGLGLAMIYDSRDHNLFPFTGWYMIFSHHQYSRYFGGNTDIGSLRLDLRKYWNPGKGGHVIAVQGVAQVHSNPPPFKMMSTFGGPELMRGYFYGRYRDQHMYALQAEYRFPLFWRFMGAAFAGVGNTSGPYSSGSFNNLKFAGGGGLRFTLDARERINIRFDAGFGLDGSRGFYLAIGEAF